MARLVYALNQSLDGYVDHTKFGPSLALFRHFLEHLRGVTGMVYGRRMYEVMRYWDEDQPDWEAHEREYATVWRSQPKWVVSRSLNSVGPNAMLVADDVETSIRGLKAELAGEIEVGGPELVRSLSNLDLIDEYRLYFHPVVFGSGKLFFAGPQRRLRLVNELVEAKHKLQLRRVLARWARYDLIAIDEVGYVSWQMSAQSSCFK